jgi:hypothetical protein
LTTNTKAKNRKANEVYRLEKNVEDPRYEGFGLDREDSLRGKYGIDADFMPDDISTKRRAWTVTRMARLWTPQPVSGRVRPYNDYPCCNLSIPAFSERAVEALRDMLEPNGELLPLVSSVGTYYAYNVTTVADILDTDRSEVDWILHAEGVIASSITQHEFRQEKLDGLSIFRLVEDPARTYVTNLFVERVRAHHLRGFVFKKLWPHAAPDDHPEDEGADEGVTAESVIVQLALAKSKPSKAEKQRVGDLMDRIDSWLYSAECEGTYLGSLEGHEYVRRECRLFLSCPGADALADWLTPHLKAVAWDGDVMLVRRYGPFDSFGEPDFPEVRSRV